MLFSICPPGGLKTQNYLMNMMELEVTGVTGCLAGELKNRLQFLISVPA